MGSCPDTDIVTSRFFSVTLKMLNFFTVFALLPYEPFTNERLLLTTTHKLLESI